MSSIAAHSSCWHHHARQTCDHSNARTEPSCHHHSPPLLRSSSTVLSNYRPALIYDELCSNRVLNITSAVQTVTVRSQLCLCTRWTGHFKTLDRCVRHTEPEISKSKYGLETKSSRRSETKLKFTCSASMCWFLLPAFTI